MRNILFVFILVILGSTTSYADPYKGSNGICKIRLQTEIVVLQTNFTRMEKTLYVNGFAKCLSDVAVIGSNWKSMQYLDPDISPYTQYQEFMTDLVEIEYEYNGKDGKDYSGILVINR